jgi:RIO kinase 1
MRAMATRTSFGKELIAGQWAAAEFDALSRLWQVGTESGLIRVPYPVQLAGTELMLEFIGDWATGEAAPRLAQVERLQRPSPNSGADGRRDVRTGPGPGGAR